MFVWLSSPELAVRRVADRVAQGGHGISEGTIIRRYHRGLRNFWTRYRPLAHVWTVCDNSGRDLVTVSQEEGTDEPRVLDPTRWVKFRASMQNA
jgi:predicted ABC-type ATPase